MVKVGGAVSGWGVMTRTTLHLVASNPAAMTRRTISLLVKIPAILGGPTWPGVAGSMTQTAVVRRSFISFATSFTVVFGPTVAGWVREKRYFKPGAFPANSTTGRWEDVGHYTQLMWRDTRQVGCALATGAREDVLVCRYSAAGNYVGERPF